MSTRTEDAPQPRAPLSRDRVLRAAVDLADDDGLDALTMRNLATRLGVEAMSLYYHVANKEAILDGVVEMVVGEINEAVAAIEVPGPGDWKAAMRARILAARAVLLRHRWAPTVIETRTTMNPEILAYYDGILGLFRQGGFSYDLAHHAMHALGSRALGFTQELFDPADGDDDADEESKAMLESMAEQLPHLVGMMMEITHEHPESTLGWCDDQVEFEFGLDLILDGLDRRRNGA